MTGLIKSVRQVDMTHIDKSAFKESYVGCLVLTKDHKILLQQRGIDWDHFPGYLAEFGGRIELDESPIQALMRELNEELGAQVKASDVITLGAITEEATKYSELIYLYFWHDRHGTITGCYEGEARYFNNIKAVLNHPKIMDSVRWLLHQCHHQQLIK